VKQESGNRGGCTDGGALRAIKIENDPPQGGRKRTQIRTHLLKGWAMCKEKTYGTLTRSIEKNESQTPLSKQWRWGWDWGETERNGGKQKEGYEIITYRQTNEKSKG